jgi:hypothetical protein
VRLPGMTPVAPVRPAAVPGPCLTASPWAGRIIGVLFTVTVVLFLLGLLTLGI